MFNRIGTIYPRALNKGFSSSFFVGSRVRYQTPEEGQKSFSPNRCTNDDGVNNLNIPSGKI